MTYQVKRRLLTAEAYHHLADSGLFGENDRIELLNGELIEMSPIGSRHAAQVKYLRELLPGFVRTPGNTLFGTQDPIALGDFSEPQPDISVLRFRDDYYVHAHPRPEDVLLLIEVSDSSIEFDRTIKLPLYASAQIPEVWLLNLSEKQLEIYRSPDGGKYTELLRFSSGDQALLEGLFGSLRVSDLFISGL